MDARVSRAARADLVPFVGAGLPRSLRSASSGRPLTPSWREFLEAAIREVDAPIRSRIQTAFESGDLVGAASLVRQCLPTAAWNALIRSTFAISRPAVHERELALVRAVWRTSSGLVVTTNYDDSLQWGTDTPPRVFGLDAPIDLSMLMTASSRKPVLWHLHGRAARPETIVIAQEGYTSLYAPTPTEETRFRAAILGLSLICATRSLLFVGSSLRDQDILRIVRDIADVFPGSVREHFVLCHRNELDDIEMRLSDARLENVTPIPFQAFGEDMRVAIEELANETGDLHGHSLGPPKYKLAWARRRCRTIVAGSDSFISRVTPLLTEHRPTRAAEILADLAIEGRTPFERAAASLLRYEFEGRIERMLEASSTEVADRAERRNLDLFKAIALEKLERADTALDILQEISEDESVPYDLRRCAEFNRRVCQEKLGHSVTFEPYFADRTARTGCGELIWTKAFNMELVLCGTRGLEFDHADLLEAAISAEISDASSGFVKTIVNWSHLTGETIDAQTLSRIEEQVKFTSLTTRIAVLTYLETEVKGEHLSEAIQEVLEAQTADTAIRKLAPVMRLHGRFTLYGEYLMHSTTWGYVAPTRMYLESSADSAGSWVLDADRVARRISDMGLHTQAVISGDLPFGRGFASSTVLALLHIGRQLDADRAEAVTNMLDWMTHGFEPSGVDAKAIRAQAPGLFRLETWRSAPELDVNGVFVKTPKGEARRPNMIRQVIERSSQRLTLLADRLTDSVEDGRLDLAAFSDYCELLAGIGVYSARQQDLVRRFLDAGLPAKGIGGLYDRAVVVIGDEARIEQVLGNVPDAEVIGRL